MHKTIGEIEQLPCTELAEWEAYFCTTPMPDHYWIGALIAWSIATFNGFSKKAYEVDDFLPRMVKRRVSK